MRGSRATLAALLCLAVTSAPAAAAERISFKSVTDPNAATYCLISYTFSALSDGTAYYYTFDYLAAGSTTWTLKYVEGGFTAAGSTQTGSRQNELLASGFSKSSVVKWRLNLHLGTADGTTVASKEARNRCT